MSTEKNIQTILEENEFIAVNKPAGLLMHEAKAKKKENTLTEWVKKHYPETQKVGDDPHIRPGIIHRLDKETSGVIIIARTQNFFEYFKKLLQNHEVEKEYIALVHGAIKGPQTIDTPIGLKSGTTKRSTRGKRKMIKEARTEIEPVKKSDSYTLIRAYPKTGRTHQIRVHLASIGHPIVGDKLYGGKRETHGLARHFLHAQSIEFSLQSGKRIRIEAELPSELKNLIKTL
jgi:23S rRNA pseudouridine1911/1915/1917 synthase